MKLLYHIALLLSTKNDIIFLKIAICIKNALFCLNFLHKNASSTQKAFKNQPFLTVFRKLLQDFLNFGQSREVTHQLFRADAIKDDLVQRVGTHRLDRYDLTFSKGHVADAITCRKNLTCRCARRCQRLSNGNALV